MSNLNVMAAPSLPVRRSQQTKEIIVIGAGPYGLSCAAHLQHAGIEPYVLGQPMAFWKENMPGGMLLRSKSEASNISAPQKLLSIEGYEKHLRRRVPDPVPIEDFIAYGEWFQKQIAPNLDTRMVLKVTREGREFEITLVDGERLRAKSVVLALGIGFFSHRPEEFAGISRDLAPHSSNLNDFSHFKGKRVAVLGKGQSALEYAALLNEIRTDIQIITHAPGLTYHPLT